MEIINKENIIATLFILGFDKVDTILYSFTLCKIIRSDKYMFIFVDEETSYAFDEYVFFDGASYKLNEGYKLDTNLSKNSEYNNLLSKVLYTNDKLIDYLSNVDFKEIVLKKIKYLGYNNIDKYNYLFSNKEKEIIKELNIVNYIENQNELKNQTDIDTENECYTLKRIKQSKVYKENNDREK